MGERIWDDAEALDQIADILGLYTTDPDNNPVAGVLNDITSYVQNTGRSTDVPEGA
jgi:glutamate 5-kinase